MINQEPDLSNLMPDTFADLGNASYGAPIDDYQAQTNDYDLRGPNAQFIASNASYDDENTGTGGNSGIVDPDLASCNAALNEALDKIEDLCSERPPAGSWSANRGVFSNVTSGSCNQFIYYGQQYNAATLSQSLSFLGNSLGNGYKIINTLGTITALYQVRKSDGQVFPPNPVNSDGTFSCMFIYGSIQIKKYNPSTGLYGSSQAGISTGSSGIGEYGVFHITNYAWSDTPPDNPYQIGTIIKETAEDEFIFTSKNDPCG